MAGDMRVAMYYSNNDVRLEKMPMPSIGGGEILVRVDSSGICGTDVLEWYRIHKVPLVLGHEIAGVVVEAGKDVKKVKAGDRVSVSHHVPCGECRFCLDGHETVCDTLRKTNFDPGGFSEFIRVPEINVEKGTYVIPENVSMDEATFIEPLACAIRGQRLARFTSAKSVLVIGSGISGLLHIQLARMGGASRIIATDIVDYRLKAAKRFGADTVISAKDYSVDKLRCANLGNPADLVAICSGADQAFEQGLRSVERGGTVMIFAAAGKDSRFTVPINDMFWRSEVTVMSSYAGSPDDHRQAISLISSRKVNVKDMITHRFSLGDTVKGFRLVAEARDSIKVIIEPQK